MKKRIKNLFPLPVLAAVLGLVLAGQATAQTFTTLYCFTNGSDGAHPWAGLILSGNTLYGTALAGGGSGNGAVFALSTDGTGFTNLHSFTALSGFAPSTNGDGAIPYAGLVLSGNTLYGTAAVGGLAGDGTVFALNTDGTGFTNLYSFTNGSDGANPWAGLILSGNTLYGTARAGGGSGEGTVFAVSTDGTGFTNLHSFSGSDGDAPLAALLLSGDTLYGTASGGGSSGNGTVFAVNTNGTGFTNLHSFTANPAPRHTNSDGAEPYAGLILSGNTLYGTAIVGGLAANGTVFALNTDGTGFTNLYSFTLGSDGLDPLAGLILSGSTLYGTANGGGSGGWGTVFAVGTDGTGITNLHSFTAGAGSYPSIINSDGAVPQAALVLSGNTLYGTAYTGGTSAWGTVFSLILPAPQLTITASGANFIMAWPTNYAGFDDTGYTLQSATNLGSSAVWTTNSSSPVVVNGKLTVTNFISGTQQFYRLSQ
jgi:uncharacterized repeat protein (TIGR03803 family)